MAKFSVRCRVDAFIDYVTEVSATSAVEAAALASNAPEKFEWKRDGEAEFDARVFYALDDDGCEIEASAQGDL